MTSPRNAWARASTLPVGNTSAFCPARAVSVGPMQPSLSLTTTGKPTMADSVIVSGCASSSAGCTDLKHKRVLSCPRGVRGTDAAESVTHNHGQTHHGRLRDRERMRVFLSRMDEDIGGRVGGGQFALAQEAEELAAGSN